MARPYHRFLLGLTAAWLLLSGVPAAEAASPPPDAVFVHGDIYPGAIAKRGAEVEWVVAPRAQALAVRNGRVAAIGSDAEIAKLASKGTQVVDLGGHFVLPGFNDAHLHLASGGFEKLNVDLKGTHSLKEVQERVRLAALRAAPGQWLVGGGWDHTSWADPRLPSRADLDLVTSGHPAFLTRIDGHIALANSAALKAAGLARSSPDPQGGKLDHEASGELTGIVRETAQATVRAQIPPPSLEQRKKAAALVLEELARTGITSVQDFSEWDDFLTYEALEREGRLSARISEWLTFGTPLATLKEQRAHHDANDLWLRTGMLKGYMDGSLGSRTAALMAPYADDPGNSGLPRYGAELTELARQRAAEGFQLGFHAIGDRAIGMALDAFESSRALYKAGDPRFRLEHAQVFAPGQISRLASLGVIASVQPCHLLTDMTWARARLGPERAALSYPWADLQRGGVTLAFGTDFPVEPLTPFRGLYAAVTRKNEAGTASYFPEQALTIDRAIHAYTVGSAYAEHAEHDKGSLQVGMLADFAVLDRDITRVPAAEILSARVLRTVVGGKTVFPAP